MPTDRPRTQIEKRNFNYMIDLMSQLEWDLHQPFSRGDAIPDGWAEIAARPKVSKKKRITLGVEEDVLKFFRALGHPYQPRMNDVLKAFMHTKLSGLIAWADTMDEEIFERMERNPRPELGDFERMRESIRDKNSGGEG